MITLEAPASRCACAFSPSVKMPVDSITMSTPSCRQGSLTGSRSLNALMAWPLIVISPSPAVTSPWKRP